MLLEKLIVALASRGKGQQPKLAALFKPRHYSVIHTAPSLACSYELVIK